MSSGVTSALSSMFSFVEIVSYCSRSKTWSRTIVPSGSTIEVAVSKSSSIRCSSFLLNASSTVFILIVVVPTRHSYLNLLRFLLRSELIFDTIRPTDRFGRAGRLSAECRTVAGAPE